MSGNCHDSAGSHLRPSAIVPMKEEQTRAEGSHDVTSPPEAPELPTEKAFVLQLTRDTGPSLEPFAGRVEHIASGRRLRFGGFAAFRAALTRLLAEAGRS